MKITTILGSPRKHGNTATILAAFEELIPDEHIVGRINLPRSELQGCLGCDGCQRVADSHGCVQQDRICDVLDSIQSADLVVYATPVYVWDCSTQMKAVWDRLYSTVKWRDRGRPICLLHGKPAMLLATCGGAAASNGDLIEQVFRREMNYLGCRVAGVHIVDNCSEPSELGQRLATTAMEMIGSAGLD
jgi:multimeric flavodoxin WrbA